MIIDVPNYIIRDILHPLRYTTAMTVYIAEGTFVFLSAG